MHIMHMYISYGLPCRACILVFYIVYSGGLEQWMSGMGETLSQQDLIAARAKLVEGQIEGFKVIYAC